MNISNLSPTSIGTITGIATAACMTALATKMDTYQCADILQITSVSLGAGLSAGLFKSYAQGKNYRATTIQAQAIADGLNSMQLMAAASSGLLATLSLAHFLMMHF